MGSAGFCFSFKHTMCTCVDALMGAVVVVVVVVVGVGVWDLPLIFEARAERMYAERRLTVGWVTSTGNVTSTPVCFHRINVSLIAKNEVPPKLKKLSSPSIFCVST